MTFILAFILLFIIWKLAFWLYDLYCARMRLSRISRDILSKNNSLPESMRVPDLKKHLRGMDAAHGETYKHFYTWDRYNSRNERKNRAHCHSYGSGGYQCEFVEYHKISDAMEQLVSSHKALETERMREGLDTGATPAGRVLSTLQSNNQAVQDVINYLKESK